jgi:phospholipase C
MDKVFEPVRTWHYAVSAGDALTDEWPLEAFEDGNYHLRVYGPNGFFGEFIGSPNDPQIKIECNPAFTKRYAGRVETGKESISDPFMGRSI